MPNKAKLLRKLLEFKETGHPINLWLSFPQNSCCFGFGKSRKPVPIGALFLLWSAGWPYLQTCQECQDKAYMIAFGGLLSVGGGHLICPTCESSWYQHLGGLGTVRDYIEKSPLKGTEFYPTGMYFGSAYTSEGKDLRKLLGVSEHPELEAGVSFEMSEDKFSQELPIEVKETASDAEFADFYARLGMDYVCSTEYDKGIEYLSKAIKLGASGSTIYSSRGEAYVCKGEPDLAIADLSKAIQMEPNFPTNYWYRAMVYYKKERWDLALDDLKTGIARDPNDTYVFTTMGRAHLDAGNWAQAILEFAEYIGGIRGH